MQPRLTIERITTHGRLSAFTIARDNVVFPDPELPATPMMLVLSHGGEYLALWIVFVIEVCEGQIVRERVGVEGRLQRESTMVEIV